MNRLNKEWTFTVGNESCQLVSTKGCHNWALILKGYAL